MQNNMYDITVQYKANRIKNYEMCISFGGKE